MDYSKYTVDDFMADEAFIAWVKTGKDNAFWNTFIKNNPQQQITISQAKALIEAVGTLPTASLSEAAKAEMWQRIDWRLEEDLIEETPLKVRSSYRLWWAAAASVALFISVGGFLFFNKMPKNAQNTYGTSRETREGGIAIEKNENKQNGLSNNTNLTEFSNDQTKPRLFNLPDGSTILLSTDSRFSFNEKTFNTDKREINFTGEAFFEIAKNPEKPFFIHANGLVTKVLGTSFTIKAKAKDKNITVAVRTGKVSVFPEISSEKVRNLVENPANGIVLTPNQQAFFIKETEKLVKTLVEKPVILVPPQVETFDFNFNQTPIADVFGVLEKAYGVKIIFDEKVLTHCTITAPLADESLFDKLALICKITRSSYEVLDGQVIITSRGCK
jgi:transmembrane sensor